MGKREKGKGNRKKVGSNYPFTVYRLPFTILLFAICYLIFTSHPAFAKTPKVYTPESNYKYEQKILRKVEKEKYERSLLPTSGYMTKEEYEAISIDIPNSEITIPQYKLPKDIKMKYVPQPTYKLTRYNNPPGSVELNIGRKFKYDRKFICPGITSPNKDILVYPMINYYANNQCTSADLFVIPLDTTLPYVQRIMRANIIKQIPKPILSTDKGIEEKFIFRTMTPIDFSPDGSKLLVKEKIGNINDGIWQTNVWVYDFNTKTARKIPEIRDSIKFYWNNAMGLTLDEKRWDIYPLGFEAEDSNRVVVTAYGYTGKIPKFLGTWSVDFQGEQSRMISIFKVDGKVSISGYKLIQDGYVDPVVVKKEEKKADKEIKKKRKAEKKVIKKDKKAKKHVYKQKIKTMKKEEKAVVREYNKEKRKSYPTEFGK